jgi:hypothetical protein
MSKTKTKHRNKRIRNQKNRNDLRATEKARRVQARRAKRGA